MSYAKLLHDAYLIPFLCAWNESRQAPIQKYHERFPWYFHKWAIYENTMDFMVVSMDDL